MDIHKSFNFEEYEYMRIALESLDTICYVSNPETYELLYINKKTRELLHVSDESYKGKKCYELLQNKNEPCEFCTNSKLKENEFYTWEYYNPVYKIFASITDTLCKTKSGQLLRVEVARDITELKKQVMGLSEDLEFQQFIVKCLKIFQYEKNIDIAINNFLSVVGEYYQAERAYIFDINYKENNFTNSYEWCKNNIEPQIDNLQKLPIEWVYGWIDNFKKHGEFYITSLESDVKKDDISYNILKEQGITSLMAAPLKIDDAIIGFLGVDNPTKNVSNMELLKSVTFFVHEEREAYLSNQQLEYLSYIDTLTSVYNRNKFIYDSKILQEKEIQSIGVCYADVNGLKTINDKYGHEAGDKLIIKASSMLKQVFDNYIYRVGGDEFVVLLKDIDKVSFEKKVTEIKKLIAFEKIANISIGYIWENKNINIHQLVTKADTFMYNDKQNYYRSIANSKNTCFKIAESKLIKDLDNNKINVFYEPIIDLKTSEIVAVQCIASQSKDKKKHIKISEIISIYEEEGLMIKLDEYILNKVFISQKHWIENGMNLPILLKPSISSISQSDFPDKIIALCKKYNVPRELIILDIKSDLYSLSEENLNALLLSFERKNIKISLDDFGINLSNINVLFSYKFNLIRISDVLMNKVFPNSYEAKLYNKIIDLCKVNSHSKVLAKGVETREQHKFLLNTNCDLAKGSYYSELLTAEEMSNYLLIAR